ncbi:MAG: hypothetical protein Ct9H300mP1_15650 [Planctomycetaceae bacterium]|nr:MAG: hypothetical protein Ct9H300mP1_15650 [Planctomycetaceae bacterium]
MDTQRSASRWRRDGFWNDRDGQQAEPLETPQARRTADEDSPGLLGDLCASWSFQGNSRLSVANRDGIERNMLRELFSGEHLIESIRKSTSLPKLAADATFESGTISGPGNWRDKQQREGSGGHRGHQRTGRSIQHRIPTAIATLTARRGPPGQPPELEDARQHRANQLDDA